MTRKRRNVATTADELLTQARQELRLAARSLPARGPLSGRPAAVRDAAVSVVAAWPQLAQAQQYALGVLTKPVGQERHLGRVGPVMDRLAKIAAWEPIEVEPEPRLIRAAEFTRAAGDALQLTSPPAGYSYERGGSIDSVLSAVDGIAQITTAYLEQAQRNDAAAPIPGRTAGLFLELSAAAHGALEIEDPTRRVSPTGSVPIVATTDVGLEAGLERWRHAVLQIAQPSITPSADLPVVAGGLWQLYAAAHHVGVPGADDAANAWRDVAVAGWGRSLRVPGPLAPDLRAANSYLVETLSSTAQTNPGQAAEALGYFIGHQAEVLHDAYEQQVQTIVASEQAMVSARLLASVTPTPRSPELMNAAHRGRWVALPSESPLAVSLTDNVHSAVQVSNHAALIVRTREMHGHSFPSGRFAPGRGRSTDTSHGTSAARWMQRQPDVGRDR